LRASLEAGDGFGPSPRPPEHRKDDPQLRRRSKCPDRLQEGCGKVGVSPVWNREEELVLVAPTVPADGNPSGGLQLPKTIPGALGGKPRGLLDRAPRKRSLRKHPRSFGRIVAIGEMEERKKRAERRIAPLGHLREDRITDRNAEETRRKRLGGV